MVLAAMSGTNGQWTSSLVNRTASFICIGLYNVRDRDSSALSAHDPVSDNAEKEHILDGPLKMSGEKLVSFLAIRTHAFVIIIIIIHEFHRDASLEQKLQGRYVSRITLMSMLLWPIVCVAV